MSTRPLKLTFRVLRQRPLPFFLIWILLVPSLVASQYADEIFPADVPRLSLYLGLTLFTAILMLLLQIGAGATVLETRRVLKGLPSDLGDSFRTTFGRMSRLLLSSAILGIAVVLGILAYLIPAVIVLTVYAFVPYFIVTDEPAPLMAYFDRSLKLALRRWGWLLFGVLVSVVLEFALDLGGREIQLGNTALWGLLFSGALTYILNIVTQVWLACNFVLLKGDVPA